MNKLDINSYGTIISFCDFKTFSKLSVTDKNFNNLSNKYNFRTKQKIMNAYNHGIVYDVYKEYKLSLIILDMKNPEVLVIIIENLLDYLKTNNIKMKSGLFLWFYDYIETILGRWDKNRDIPKILAILNKYKNETNTPYINFIERKFTRQIYLVAGGT